MTIRINARSDQSIFLILTSDQNDYNSKGRQWDQFKPSIWGDNKLTGGVQKADKDRTKTGHKN